MVRKEVLVTEKGKEYKFRSMTLAARFLGMKQSTLSNIMSRKGGDGGEFTVAFTGKVNQKGYNND